MRVTTDREESINYVICNLSTSTQIMPCFWIKFCNGSNVAGITDSNYPLLTNDNSCTVFLLPFIGRLFIIFSLFFPNLVVLLIYESLNPRGSGTVERENHMTRQKDLTQFHWFLTCSVVVTCVFVCDN